MVILIIIIKNIVKVNIKFTTTVIVRNIRCIRLWV